VEDVGVDVVGRDLSRDILARLRLHLFTERPPRPGRRLVGGDGDVPETEGAVQWCQGHRERGGHAVGVGDDPVVLAHLLAVDLGHDQGDLGVHPEEARLVDGDAAPGGDQGGVLLGVAPPAAKKTMSQPSRRAASTAATVNASPRNVTVLPALRGDASTRSSRSGTCGPREPAGPWNRRLRWHRRGRRLETTSRLN